MTPTDIEKLTEARQVLVSAIASFDGHIAESLAPLFECIEEKISAALEAKDAEIERLTKALGPEAGEVWRNLHLRIAENIAKREAAEAALKEAREGLAKIAAPAPTAAELDVPPGVDYWSTVATRRQDMARALLSKQDSGGRS